MNTFQRMPAVFFGHGSPMNTLEQNRYTMAWRAIGASLPRPRAILMISAHWYINATVVTAMARPRTIHDFYGFPKALFEVQYPAPGLPELAGEVAEAVHPDHVSADTESWGLDHGTWSVLVHAFPNADIPVVQLSINAAKPLAYHVALGARLATMRDRGILVMASGNVVHNLRLMNWKTPDAAFAWARDFNQHAIAVLTERPGDAAGLQDHREYARAVPTPDHFLPLLYLAGFAAATGSKPAPLIDGYAYGSLSMTCFGIDLPGKSSPDAAGAAPFGGALPADQTNM